MGDYNVDVKETNMKVLCSQHKLKGTYVLQKL